MLVSANERGAIMTTNGLLIKAFGFISILHAHKDACAIERTEPAQCMLVIEFERRQQGNELSWFR